MNNQYDELLERMRRGESVTDADIQAVQTNAQRTLIEAEAKRRAGIEAEEKERAAQTERRLQKMIFLARDAQNGARELEAEAAEFDKICADFGQRHLAKKARVVAAQTAFGRELRAMIPNINDIGGESEMNHLFKTLETRGAPLDEIRAECWQPNLQRQPVWVRLTGGYQFPATLFGALINQIEKIFVRSLSETETPPKPEPTESELREHFERFNQLQAARRKQNERADYGNNEPPKAA